MRCVSCGKKEAFEEGLCQNCFSEKHPLVLEEDEIRICRECGAAFVEGWRKDDVKEKYMHSVLKGFDIVDAFTEGKKDEAKYFMNEKEGGFHIVVETKKIFPPHRELFQSASFFLRKRYTLCPVCQKKKSGYFEAIVQVRREDGVLTEKEKEMFEGDVLRFVEGQKDSFAFISNIRDLHEGMNFEMGGKKVGRHVAAFLKKKHGGQLSESNKIMGRDKRTGKDILRLTTMLKLPSLKGGEYVFFEGDVFRVESVSQTVKLVNAGRQKTIPSDTISALEKRGKLRRLDVSPEKVLLTSLSPQHVEILRKDYTTSIFPIPKNLRMRIGEEYEVIILEDKLFWV